MSLDWISKQHTNIHLASQSISVTSHERCGVSIHRQLNCLCNFYDNMKKKINRWPVDSLHKGPVMRKALPFNDVILKSYSHDNFKLTLNWLGTWKWLISFKTLHSMMRLSRCGTHALARKPPESDPKNSPAIQTGNKISVIQAWSHTRSHWRSMSYLKVIVNLRADSMLASSQWETALLCNDVSHWLGASLDSALNLIIRHTLRYNLKITFNNLADLETSARPLANASENLATQMENRPGQVEFCIVYIRDCPVRASAKNF